MNSKWWEFMLLSKWRDVADVAPYWKISRTKQFVNKVTWHLACLGACTHVLVCVGGSWGGRQKIWQKCFLLSRIKHVTNICRYFLRLHFLSLFLSILVFFPFILILDFILSFFLSFFLFSISVFFCLSYLISFHCTLFSFYYFFPSM